MNPDTPVPAYVATVVRSVAATIGGWAIGKGYITAEQAPEIGGALLVLATVVWGLIQKHNAHKDLKAAIAAPAQ